MANTFGAEFFKDLNVAPGDITVLKGFAHDHPFSPFAGHTMKESPRGWVKGPDGVLWIPDKSVYNILDEYGSNGNIVDGVAGEYCVDAGMIDSVNTGVPTYANTQGIAFLDPTKRKETLEKWQDLGVICATPDKIAQLLTKK